MVLYLKNHRNIVLYVELNVALRTWIKYNLVLNDDKTELAIIATHEISSKCHIYRSMLVAISPSDPRSTRYLGVFFDCSSLQWRHSGRDSVSNHQPHDCLLNRFFRRRSKKTSKFRVTGLCAGNSPGTDEFPAQMASYAENVSIWWRHHFVALKHMLLNIPIHQQQKRLLIPPWHTGWIIGNSISLYETKQYPLKIISLYFSWVRPNYTTLNTMDGIHAYYQ